MYDSHDMTSIADARPHTDGTVRRWPARHTPRVAFAQNDSAGRPAQNEATDAVPQWNPLEGDYT